MTRKKTWYAKLHQYLTQNVSWTCVTHEEMGRDANGHDIFGRYVTMITDLDGRDVITRMSPDNARSVGELMIKIADKVDAMNAEHGNGSFYPDERVWGSYWV